jgi:hypothetical protein
MAPCCFTRSPAPSTASMRPLRPLCHLATPAPSAVLLDVIAQRVTRNNLSKLNNPATVLAVAEAPTTIPVAQTSAAACLNIIVDNDHYQSDEDDGVFRDYGDYACLATYAKTRPPPKCYDCGLDHTVCTYPKFNARTPEDKAKRGHEWGLCPKCCGGKHKPIACRTTKPCDICGTLTDHHTILHGAFIKDTSKVGNNILRQYPQPPPLQYLAQQYQQNQAAFQPQQFVQQHYQPNPQYQQPQRMTYRPNNQTTALATLAGPHQMNMQQPQMSFAMQCHNKYRHKYSNRSLILRPSKQTCLN